MTQDLYYIDEGYYDIGYFVYTADAEAAVATTSQIACTAGIIANGQASLEATFSQTAALSHIYGADLFAMSNASLAAEVSRIRDNNIAVAGVFSISTDASRTVNISASEDFAFSISMINARIRASEAAIDAAFSLAADAVRLDGGLIVEAYGTWTSSTSLNVQVELIKQSSIDATVSTQLAATISHIQGADLNAFNQVQLIASADKILSTTSSLNSTTDLAVTSLRIFDNVVHVDLTASQVISIGVIKTSTNSLTAQVDLTATISHIHGADLNAFNTAALTVSIDKYVGISLDLSLTFTQLSNVNKQAIALLDLTTSTVLDAQVQKVKEFSSNIISSSQLSADINLIKFYSNLQWVPTNGSPAYNSTYRAQPSNSGASVSLITGTLGTSRYLTTNGNASSKLSIDLSRFTAWTVEFWFGVTVNPYTTGGDGHTLFTALNDAGQTSFEIRNIKPSGGAAYTRATLYDTSGTSYVIELPTLAPSSTLTHIALQRNINGSISFYQNGLRSATYAGPATFRSNTKFQISESINDTVATSWLFDEVRVSSVARYTGLSFTVPTTKFELDTSTPLLSHFDNTISIVNSEITANLISSSFINASVIRLPGIIIDLPSQSTLSAIPENRTKDLSASLQSNGFLVSAVGRIRPFVDIEVATFSLDGSANVIKGIAVVLSSSTSLNSLITKTLGIIEINASSTAQLTANYGILTAGSVELTTSSNLDAYLGLIKRTASNQTANFALEVQVLAAKVTDASLNVITSFNLTNDKLVSGTASLSSQINLQAIAGNTVPFISTPNSSFNLDCSLERIIGIASSLDTNSQLLANVTIDKTFTIGLASQITQIVIATSTRTLVISTESIASELVAISRILKPGASLFSQSQLVANASVISSRINADLVSNLELVVRLTRLAGLSSQQIASSQLQAQLGKVVNAQAGLTMQAFTLTVLNKVTFDPELTWKIPSENRYWKIPREINLDDAIVYLVPREIRNWTIPAENNYYVVEYEDRIYKIKGK
jgi:hypothetical protein